MRGDSPQPLERGKNMDIETKRAKHNEYQRRYRERHKERVKEQAKRWRDSHKEQLKLKSQTPEYKDRHNTLRRNKNRASIENCDEYKRWKVWSDEEVKYLTDNYSTQNIYQIADYLGRSINAVERKRNKLGLRKEQKNENSNLDNRNS